MSDPIKVRAIDLGLSQINRDDPRSLYHTVVWTPEDETKRGSWAALLSLN